MNAAEGGKPPIVIGRRWRLANLVLGVALVHALLLQSPGTPPARRMGPVLTLTAAQGRPEPVVARAEAADGMPPAAAPGHVPAQAPTSAVTVPARPTSRAASQPQPPAPAVALANAPAASAATGADLDLPVYPTRLPPAVHWQYRFDRSGVAGSAELHWQADGGHYQARFTGEAGGVAVFEWSSTGAIDGAGIAPERYLDRRHHRGLKAAEFHRDSHRIRYSGASEERPLPAGAQDRLSWLPQLAGIVAAAPQRWREGQEIRLFVSGARGDAEVWRFRVMGPDTLDDGLPGGPINALKLLREPPAPYEIRAELWLDPGRHHLPVKAVFTNGATVWTLQLAAELNP